MSPLSCWDVTIGPHMEAPKLRTAFWSVRFAVKVH